MIGLEKCAWNINFRRPTTACGRQKLQESSTTPFLGAMKCAMLKSLRICCRDGCRVFNWALSICDMAWKDERWCTPRIDSILSCHCCVTVLPFSAYFITRMYTVCTSVRHSNDPCVDHMLIISRYEKVYLVLHLPVLCCSNFLNLHFGVNEVE
jgi:hypothetical protein